MAECGFDALGVDVAPIAVDRANAKLDGHVLSCRFAALDFLAATPPGGPFQFVFDCGCFHVFDELGESSGSLRESPPHWRRAALG
jgi:hypothetical protein